MTPLLLCALCVAQPSRPALRLIQAEPPAAAPAPEAAPPAPEVEAAPERSGGDLLLAASELAVLAAEPVAGVWVASARGFSPGRLALDGLGGLTGSVAFGAVGLAAGVLAGLSFCAIAPCTSQTCGPFDRQANDLFKALGAVLFGIVGMAIGAVVGIAPGTVAADRLQGHPFSAGGAGAALGLTLAVGALDAALISDVSSRGGLLGLPAVTLAGLGLLTTSVAGYALVAGR